MSIETNNPTNIYRVPRTMSADICSCAGCDSFQCFGLRYHQGKGCVCKSCNSQTCLLYQQLKVNLASNELKEKENIEQETKSIPKIKSLPDVQNKKADEDDANVALPNQGDHFQPPMSPPTRKPNVPLDEMVSKESRIRLGHNKCFDGCCTSCQIVQQQKDHENKDKIGTVCILDEDVNPDQCLVYPLNKIENSPEAMAFIQECVQREIKKLVKENSLALLLAANEETEENSNLSSTTRRPNIQSDASTSVSYVFISKAHNDAENKENIKDENLEIQRNLSPPQTNTSRPSLSCLVDKIKSYISSYKTQPAVDENTELNKNENKPNEEKGQDETEGADVKISHAQNRVHEVKKELIEFDIRVHNDVDSGYTSAAELTAQIMNVPIREYKQSIINTKEPKGSVTFNLLKRIEEAYKACSCAICECLPTSSEMLKGNESHDVKGDKNSKKARNCYRNKKSSKYDNCDCKPCECIKCIETLDTKCACKPCECIDCSTWGFNKRKTYIVAPVGQDQSRSCTCEPCACFECTTSFGLSTRTHEMGTGISRHLNCQCEECDNEDCEHDSSDTCNCVRRKKVMNKPNVKDTHEYDIRVASTKNGILRKELTFSKNVYNKQVNYDTLAMYVSASSRPKADNISSESNQHHFSANPILQPDNFPLRHNKAVLKKESLRMQPCDCKPCDCIKCQKHFAEGHKIYNNQVCNCEICDCINCATLSVKYDMENRYKSINQRDICNCKPCECIDCRKYIHSYPYDHLFNHPMHVYPDLKSDQEGPYLKAHADSQNYSNLLKLGDSEHFIDLVLTEKESKHRPEKQIPFTNESKRMYGNISRNDNVVGCSLNAENTLTKQINNSNHTWANENNNDYKIIPIDEENSTEDDTETPYLQGSTNGLNRKFDINTTDNTTRNYSELLLDYPGSAVKSCIDQIMNLDPCTKYHVSYAGWDSLNPIPPKRDELPGYSNHQKRDGLFTTTKQCKNLKSEQTCECNPCECDKFNLSLPKKPQRCLCDCAKCYCEDICNRAIIIRKNETTQTIILTTNTKYPFPNQYSYDYVSDFSQFPYFYPNNEIETFRMSGSLSEKPNDFYREAVSSRYLRTGHSPSPIRNRYISADNFNSYLKTSEINYRNAERTLQEAKQFSLDLLRILQKYEKANKEFSSVSEKCKNLHTEIRNASVKPLDINNEPRYKENKIIANQTEVESKINDHNSITVITQPNRLADESEKDLRCDLNNINSTSINKEDAANINTRVATQNKYDNIKAPTKNDPTKEKTSFNFSQESKSKLQDLKKEFLNYSMMLNQAIKRCRQEKWKHNVKYTTESPHKEDYCKKDKRNRAIYFNENDLKQKGDKKNMNEGALLVDGGGALEASSSKSLSKANDDTQTSKSPFSDSEGFNENVTEAGQLPSKSRLHEHFESTPLVATKVWNVSNGVKSSVATNATCYRGQRVRFHTIRKVSDHTVVLKWKTPEENVNVLGYELLVDGRIVQKIMSPLKNMAVVTCLPHNEKVLFTVRTLLKLSESGQKSDHLPCASYVYTLGKSSKK